MTFSLKITNEILRNAQEVENKVSAEKEQNEAARQVFIHNTKRDDKGVRRTSPPLPNMPLHASLGCYKSMSGIA